MSNEPITPKKNVIVVSASEIGEYQTREIERLFSSSRPNPRNWAMGFKGEPKKTKDLTDKRDWRD